jgi:hypothetical protein
LRTDPSVGARAREGIVPTQASPNVVRGGLLEALHGQLELGAVAVEPGLLDSQRRSQGAELVEAISTAPNRNETI